jgi:hypothetical protein
VLVRPVLTQPVLTQPVLTQPVLTQPYHARAVPPRTAARSAALSPSSTGAAAAITSA